MTHATRNTSSPIPGSTVPSQCGLTISLAKIDVGIAYAIWAAIGTATVSIAGMLLFSESFDSIKMVSLSLIVMGVVGLNLRDDP
jgi:multidrug transporter EmrE-like cation transporter